ncbi:hypothetical protein F2Q69_00011621 [Brassica cretica]|uniref:BHLH domain-containing protein n=1 Tax=Brassica cretica TaxID=69181 RepID=A0A8S9QUS4_BRACR|nr:hypothetical protein F2Q69_00011621 [Brassica cretica]
MTWLIKVVLHTLYQGSEYRRLGPDLLPVKLTSEGHTSDSSEKLSLFSSGHGKSKDDLKNLFQSNSSPQLYSNLPLFSEKQAMRPIRSDPQQNPSNPRVFFNKGLSLRLPEAVQYIQFLQEQVKVLCAPYLLNNPITTHDEELEEYSLRNSGLCLIPMEDTCA